MFSKCWMFLLWGQEASPGVPYRTSGIIFTLLNNEKRISFCLFLLLVIKMVWIRRHVKASIVNMSRDLQHRLLGHSEIFFGWFSTGSGLIFVSFKTVRIPDPAPNRRIDLVVMVVIDPGQQGQYGSGSSTVVIKLTIMNLVLH